MFLTVEAVRLDLLTEFVLPYNFKKILIMKKFIYSINITQLRFMINLKFMQLYYYIFCNFK